MKFNILSKAMGNPCTVAVERNDIENAADVLAKERGWSELTKAKYIGAGLTLLRFSRGEGKGSSKKDERPPETWDTEFIKTMMSTAEDVTPGIVAALAVLTFAGLRPHEAMRVSWDVVNFNEDIISLTGENTKTRTTRHVKITPNLKHWLLAYQGEGKLVTSPIKYRTEREKLMKALKIAKWPNDVLRHTAATMIYARTKSVDETCADLGHFGTGMFLKHYKGLAPAPADVVKFWTIAPRVKSTVNCGVAP